MAPLSFVFGSFLVAIRGHAYLIEHYSYIHPSRVFWSIQMQQQDTIPILPEDWQAALAVVAHPDDLEYGAASAIAKWTAQGKAITYVMVSRGEAGMNDQHPTEVGPLRSQEEIDARRVVGVDHGGNPGASDGVIDLPGAGARHPVVPSRPHRRNIISHAHHTCSSQRGI